MSSIIVAIIVLVVAVVIGFTAFLIFYQVRQRRSGSSGAFPTSFKNIFGGASEHETGTRFAALDVDEAWDSHVDEEMGYDSVRLHDNRKDSLSREELDDRYESVMEGGEASNPFGSGSSTVNKHQSAFKESM